ncbi:MAG: di-heme oxidoredictase family protein [Candidatus Acidiferrales bacterium]
MTKRFLITAAIAATCTLFGIGMVVGGQAIPEAPAGFDGQTNGSVPQTTMDGAAAIFTELEQPTPDGLGPVYNAVSCVDCHQSVAVGGASQVLEFRAGHNDNSRPSWFVSRRHPFDTNGSTGTFVAATAITANGTAIPDRSLINQRAICADAVEHLTDADNIRASRLSLSVLGDGFVEAVPDSTFLAIAAKNHGEAIQVPVLEANGSVTEVGKFGWKDQHASLLSFAGDAYVNEMGVTNTLFPDESTLVCQPAGMTSPNDNDDDIAQFAAFMRATMVPPRGPITPAVMQGQAIFEQIGCNNCHVETLMTAPAGTAIHGGMMTISAAIGGKQIHPFGDYLLHDIGTGDGIVQNGPADTQYKLRTMPLWGLRTRTQLMHDAQSSTYSDAIGRHAGEAAGETSKFNQLTPAQKSLLYAFLGSL